MSRLLKASLVAVALAIAAPVAAQDTGSIIQRYDRAQIDADIAKPDTQKLIYAYGACVTKSHRRLAEEFIKTFPFSKEADRAARRLEINECLQTNGSFVKVEFQGEALRGPLYKALYKTSFDSSPGEIVNAPAIDYRSGSANAPFEALAALVQLRDFADCAVRNDPATARALVVSDVQSSVEAAAFQQYGPALGGCVKVGDTIKLTKPLVRSLTAEALYRLSVAARSQAPNGMSSD